MQTTKTYRKSTFSAPQNACVELAVAPTQTSIRDSKQPAAGEITMPATTFAQFLTAVKR